MGTFLYIITDKDRDLGRSQYLLVDAEDRVAVTKRIATAFRGEVTEAGDVTYLDTEESTATDLLLDDGSALRAVLSSEGWRGRLVFPTVILEEESP